MVTVRAVGPAPEKGSVWRPLAGRFDLVGLEADIEAAVCRAWRQEMCRHRKGDVGMESGNPQGAKPAEMEAQQASVLTDGTPVASDGSTARDLCQEVLGRVLAVAEDKAVAAYQAALTEGRALAREMSRIRGQMAAAQEELARATSEAQERAEADEAALQEARGRAQEALSPYVAAGVVSSQEIETHLEAALREAREQVQAQRQEAQVRLEALQVEMRQLQARRAELDSRSASVEARLTQLRALPCVVALERAHQEEDARRRESAQAANHFLETAPWHEISWQRRLTPGLEQVVALAGEDPTIFEALVDRLGTELERVDPAARPGIGWSVVRAIEALEMSPLFPALEAKRSELVQAARKHHRERQSGPPLADKVISLASRWGARVAAR